MKIRVIDRIILFLLALVTLIAGVCAALNEFGINVLSHVSEFIPVLSADMMFIVRIAVIAVVILLSLYLFGVSFRRKRKPDPFITMVSGNKGNIRMSMDSISGLVQRTCGKMDGISNLQVKTINHEDSVSVEMEFQVEMSRNIPELSALIQQMVGEVVEKNCGVAVRNVTVTVSGFTAPVQKLEKPAKKGLFHREKKQALPVAAPAEEPVAEIVEEPVAEEPVVESVVIEETAAEEILPAEEIIEETVAEEEIPAEPEIAETEEIVEEVIEEIAEEPAVEEEISEKTPVDEDDDDYLFTENE